MLPGITIYPGEQFLNREWQRLLWRGFVSGTACSRCICLYRLALLNFLRLSYRQTASKGIQLSILCDSLWRFETTSRSRFTTSCSTSNSLSNVRTGALIFWMTTAGLSAYGTSWNPSYRADSIVIHVVAQSASSQDTYLPSPWSPYGTRLLSVFFEFVLYLARHRTECAG